MQSVGQGDPGAQGMQSVGQEHAGAQGSPHPLFAPSWVLRTGQAGVPPAPFCAPCSRKPLGFSLLQGMPLQLLGSILLKHLPQQ